MSGSGKTRNFFRVSGSGFGFRVRVPETFGFGFGFRFGYSRTFGFGLGFRFGYSRTFGDLINDVYKLCVLRFCSVLLVFLTIAMGKKRSKVYDGFSETDTHFVCKVCQKALKKCADRSTSALGRHLELHKGRTSEAPALKQPKLSFPKRATAELFEDACLSFFAAFGIPFQAVDSDEFKEVVRLSSNAQIPTRAKLSNDILARNAGRIRSTLLEDLKNRTMSLAIDEFSGRSRRITSSFIRNWNLVTRRLGIIPLGTERATAETLKSLIQEKLKEYGISQSNVVSITRDGGSNITKAARLLNIESIYCFDHLLHLCIRDSLEASSIEKTIKPVKKACVTRWNSTLTMLESYIENHHALVQFSVDPECRKLTPSKAIHEAIDIDSNVLMPLINLLRFFESITRMAEGRKSFASLIPYLIYQIRENVLEKTRHQPSQNNSILVTEFVDKFQEAFEKRVEEYRHPLLMKILFLDPRFVGVECIMDRSKWHDAEQLIRADLRSSEEADHLREERETGLADVQDGGEMYSLKPLNLSSLVSRDPIDAEISYYYGDLRIPSPTSTSNNSDEVLAYWKNNQNKLPRLAQLAEKYLCVLASSAEPERVFSGLSHLLSNTKRGNLSDSTVENLTTVRHHIAFKKLDQFDRSSFEQRKDSSVEILNESMDNSTDDSGYEDALETEADEQL
uniref:BED-type domain-containing protein n=1 Tax=Steinernema glaseri TaxID=37863 RepID=A0A1I7XXE8_9BILA